MNHAVTLAQVEQKLVTLRGSRVLLDFDVATLYGVATREINQAIQRNPDKFPDGYVIPLTRAEWQSLRSKILILKNADANADAVAEPITNRDRIDITHSSATSSTDVITNCDHITRRKASITTYAFHEKGLYMLATILKGPRAVATTLAIVETFAKIRELARTVARLSDTTEKFQQQTLMQKSGDIMADILSDGMKTTGTETSFELNLAVLKFKHTIQRRDAAKIPNPKTPNPK